MTKNEQIRQTLIETQKRRQNQILKVYEVKEDMKYMILREDCKLYSKWDTKASLIF